MKLQVYEVVVHSALHPDNKDYYEERDFFFSKKLAKAWARATAKLQFAQYKQPYRVKFFKKNYSS